MPIREGLAPKIRVLLFEFLRNKNGERCRELIDAADEMTRRLYCVVDWLALHPEYNPKTKVIPKKDYPVLVDVTF